jgi:DNA-binding transcriptional LysR family regulator
VIGVFDAHHGVRLRHNAGMNGAQLSGIEVRHLQALHAVVEEGSIRAAAERLGYAPASVSAQIASLERSVSTRLLDRDLGRAVRLTPAGEAFYGAACAALARLRAGAEEAAALRDGTPGTLRIGTFPSVGARLLPLLLLRIRERWPAAEVRLLESTSPVELEAAVEAGDVEMAFVIQPLNKPRLRSIALFEDPFCLLAPRDSPPIGVEPPITLDDLATLPLVTSGTCPHLMHLLSRMRLRGHVPLVALHTDDDAMVHSCVAAGIGYAVVASLQVDPLRQDVVAIPLGDLLPSRLIALAWTGELNAVGELVLAWARSAGPVVAAGARAEWAP